MTQALSASEKPLGDVFCDKYEFIVPYYQRPYAWTDEQTEELFNDLFDYYQESKDDLKNVDSFAPYFLGSVVLIKAGSEPRAEVIDGQQRLTTLTLLFAALHAQVQDADLKKEFQGYYYSPGSKTKGIEEKPRLTLRKRDQDFFFKYIQSVDNLAQLETLEKNDFASESQQLITINALILQKLVRENLQTDAEILAFCQCLVNRCFLAVVSTPSQESAFRVFSVLNDRGLDLLPCDVLKSEIIGKIGDENYAKQWEDLENTLERKSFNDLFAYLLAIHLRKKPNATLLELFKSSVLANVKTTEEYRDFFNNELTPCAEIFEQIKNNSLDVPQGSTAVNKILKFLNGVEISEWIPAAIYFLLRCREKKIAYSAVEKFFCKLERLTAYLYLCSVEINARIRRIAAVISGIDENRWEDEIELFPDEKNNFYETLNGPVYNMPSQKRKYMILRLNDFVTDKGMTYDWDILTLEHVLPQTPTDDYWASRWTEDKREYWTHRVANLVPLSRNKNSKAQNYAFKKKCEVYFFKNSVAPYALTWELKNFDDWTPEIVEQRQQKLMDAFVKNWELEGWNRIESSQDTGRTIKESLASNENARQEFRREFWAVFQQKLYSLGGWTTNPKPTSRYCFEVRLGKMGICLSNLCSVDAEIASVRISIAANTTSQFLPKLEENKEVLENIAETPIDWNANPEGKDRLILLKTFNFNVEDRANVDNVAEKMAESTEQFRKALYEILDENDNREYKLEELDYYGYWKDLYAVFQQRLSQQFPDLRQEIKKHYVAFKKKSTVVVVNFQKRGVKLFTGLSVDELQNLAHYEQSLVEMDKTRKDAAEIILKDEPTLKLGLEAVAKAYAKQDEKANATF